VLIPAPLVPGQPLAPVEPGLLRDSPYGPIPRLSADRKRAPWQVYAAPFEAPDSKPRLSVVVTGLGLARDVTERAIATLPPQISLSFSPYAAETPNAVAAARQRGHEALLDLALEPENYPRIDPGPATLIGAYSGSDNVARLDWVLARAQGTIGVIAQFGPSFGASAMAMAPIAQALRERGLMYVDNQASDHPAMMRLSRDFAVPWAFANAAFAPGIADEAATLVATLHQLEKASTVQRSMLALVPVSPVAIQTIANWAKTVEPRGFALAPVSAIASRQDERDVGRK
ncbi:divergent polysaccharide deacetylase family protein, partial [Elstera litoralis]|uniref:divergent polysaccharide deacetylase family protein n=1 Tax=Elstera litoralis TaxID=552518 RepID=UPI000697B183